MSDPVQLELDFGKPPPLYEVKELPANGKQVGGQHYKQLDPQPWDVIASWGLGFLDGNVVKYIARWRSKDGLKDLHKARHYLDKLIEEAEGRL